MSSLFSKRCNPLGPRASALKADKIEKLLAEVSGWSVAQGELTRTFKFKDYHDSVAFVNATVWISNAQDHHPEIELGYNKVKMRYSTHDVKGLTENDFICAAHVNELLKEQGMP